MNAVRQWVADRAVEFITSFYAAWRLDRSRKEPAITVGLVWDFLKQSAAPDDYRFMTDRRQRAMVWSVLEALRRKGALGSSTGVSSSGREARCYEPA